MRFVWWPHGKDDWAGVAGTVLPIAGVVLALLTVGLLQSAPMGIKALVVLAGAIGWVSYRFYKARNP